MAVLDTAELQSGMRAMAKQNAVVSWSKAEVLAALQAVENWFEANKAGAGTAIETAAPGVFTNAQKKKLGGVWMIRKANRELL